MLVVTFAATGNGNCVVVGGNPFVLIRTTHGPSLLRASCPHRRGPLHLAEVDVCGRKLVCPWHGNRYPHTRSREAAVPLVRSGNRVNAVFPGDPGAGYRQEYRPVAPWLQAVGDQPGMSVPAPRSEWPAALEPVR